MAKKVLREEEKKKPIPPFEMVGDKNEDTSTSGIDVDKLLVDFGRFTEEAAAHINSTDAKVAEITTKMGEIAARVDALTAIVNQLNVEMSKLTGDLYRTINANETFHRDLATLVGELARTLPAAIDTRISQLIEVEEAELPKAPEKPEEKKPE